MTQPFGTIIDTYRRADAIADGALVDVTATAREAGIRLPVALTRAVWEACVAWTENDNQRKRTLQDEPGRLWDVLWMTRLAVAQAAGRTSRARVNLVRVPREGKGRSPRPVVLEAVCGPDDDGSPVITVQQPGED